MFRSVFLAAFLIILSSLSVRAQDDWHFVDESASRLPDTCTLSQALDGGDVNGDGAIDILVGQFPDIIRNLPGNAQLFLNDSAGYFSLAEGDVFPQRDDFATVVLLFDNQEDGYLDAMIANANSLTDYIAVNDRNNNFYIDWARLPRDTASALTGAYGDIDNDGDIDVCLLGNNEMRFSHRMWINDGNGYFHDEIGRLPTLYNYYRYVGFADLNSDLAPDIVAVYYDGYESHPTVFINDGTGHFMDESSLRLPPTENHCFGADLVDIDGDGDFDFVLAYSSGLGFLINDGNGYFIDDTEQRGRNAVANDIKSSDIDNDGDEDLIVGGGNLGFIFINDGNGYFTDETSIRWPNQTRSITKLLLGDFDEDGVSDIFRVGLTGCYSSVFINTLNSPDSIPPHIMNQSILPAIDTLRGPYPVKLMAKDGISIPYQLSVHVHYSTDRITYQADSLHYTGAYIYYGTIPEADSGETIYYYYTAEDHWHNISRVPEGAPDSVFSFTYLPGYVGIEEDGGHLPEELSISAYPNPFNSSTTIFIRGVEKARIIITDITGRQVAGLEVKNGRAVWNAVGFASGNYFASVSSANCINRLKLILLK